MIGDQDALPLLLDLMTEAGYHDTEACLRLLDQIGPLIGPLVHKSREDVDVARVAVHDRAWAVVWARAYHATQGLTWAFPPDLATCAPRPRLVPFERDAACGCGATMRPGAGFCHQCGAPAWPSPSI